MKLGIFTDEKGRERRPNFPEEHGSFQFDETDYLLYALLCDPVYCAELLCQDSSNRDYGGCYAVRDYQYVLNRGMGSNYEGYACGRSTGKALASDALVLTPGAGYVKIEALDIGDLVVGSDGRPTPVLGVYPQGERDLWRVEFTDGAVVECDDEHLWTVTCDGWQSRGIGERTMRLREMRERRARFKVRLPSGPVHFFSTPTEIDPWLLGALLGDGNLTRPEMIRFASVDSENIERVRDALPQDAELVHDGGCNYRMRSREYVLVRPGTRSPGRAAHSLLQWTRARGLHGLAAHEKHIPPNYLWGSPDVRLAVLRGLADTDGSVDRSGSVEISSASERLALEIRQVVLSLGGRASIRRGETPCRDRYRVLFRIPGINPFLLSRKSDAYERANEKRVKDCDWRLIKSITPTGRRAATCIEVGALDGLFMTSDMVLTHNTESIKNRALAHVFRRMPGQNLLVTAPELIHLLPLTDAIEDRITGCRLTRGFLDVSNNSTGFQHRPFQCVAGGELVFTKRGHIPIEHVCVGDVVLTHRSRWRRVTHTWDRGIQDVSRIRGSGSAGLVATGDHRLYARRVKQRQALGATGKRVMRWEQQAPEWLAIDQWRIQEPAHRCALPATFPKAEAPPPFRLNKSGFGVGRGRMLFPESPELLWILGLYLAEGSTWRGKLTIFSIHSCEAEYVGERFRRVGLPSKTTVNTGAGVDIRIGNMALAGFLEREFPGNARTKDVPTWVYGLDRDQRIAFLDGLMYGDGYKTSRGAWRGSFASRPLMQSVGLLAHSLGWVFGTSPVPAKTHSMKSGHVIHAGPQWEFYVNPSTDSSHTHIEFHEGLAWTAATRIEPLGRQRVYDLTVEEDHSFVASGVVVSNCNFLDGTKIIGRIPRMSGTGVKGMHQPDLIIDEAQNYPTAGWTEVHETVEKSIPDFSYVFYGVHSGDRATGFHKRITQGGFKIHTVTAMQRPTWNAAEKNAARAAYGGSQAPDYRRNILGEAGGASSPLFNLARLVGCMEQDRESPYNLTGYKHQEIRSEEFDEMMLPISDLLDLPSGLKTVWAGADLGLTNAPTVITVWSEEKVKGERRLKLVRRIHLVRMRTRVIRHAIYALFDHFGGALQGFGMDETGLGAPIFQEIEDDEAKPEGIMERFSGWFFNAKTPVGLERTHLRQDERGQWKDQYGAAVEERINEMTGAKEYVIYMPMIEASTRYLREFVDSGFMMLPFDPEIVSDMTGETTQRVRRIAGLKSKPNAFHILDSMRAMSMAYMRASVEAQLAVPVQVPVLDIAV